jgi:predicted MFS family arabinose efflux permease
MSHLLQEPNPLQTSAKHSHFLPWIVWFLAALFYLYENVIQVSPGVMVPDLMTAFSINSAALGGVIAFFFYSYASMQIPVGVLVDHYNARTLLTIACISCALGCVLFACAHSILMIALGRLLIGFGAAFAAVCSMKLASTWFPARQFSLLVGLMVTMGMLGSMIGETPLAIFVDNIGWRHAMLLMAGIGVVLAALIACIVKQAPHTKQIKTHDNSYEKTNLLHGLITVFKSTQSWIIAIYGGLMFASTSIFGGLWGVPFLMKAYTLDKPTAAGIVSIMFLGWVLGSPLSGVLTNLLNSYKKILIISSVGALIIMIGILYVPHLPLFALSILIFCFGVFSSFFLPSFTLMHDLHAATCSGAALGFMNTANMIGGALGQPLIGILLDATWDGTMLEQVRIYSVANYQWSLSCLPIMIFLSLILIPLIHEKRV